MRSLLLLFCAAVARRWWIIHRICADDVDLVIHANFSSTPPAGRAVTRFGWDQGEDLRAATQAIANWLNYRRPLGQCSLAGRSDLIQDHHSIRSRMPAPWTGTASTGAQARTCPAGSSVRPISGAWGTFPCVV